MTFPLPYSKQQWADNNISSPYGPISGARLQHIEDGLAAMFVSAVSVTTTSGSPQYTIPAGSNIFNISQYGSILGGLNPDLTDEIGAHQSVQHQMVDFAYLSSTLRIYSRSLRLAELGDPPDLILGRWGPNNGYPYASKTGMNTGQSIGSIRWMPAVNSFGATPDVTLGGSLQVDSGSINVKTDEIPRDTTGSGNYAVGAHMSFNIAPIGGVATEQVRLLSTGHVWIGSQTLGNATDTAMLTMFTEAIGTKGLVIKGISGQTADLLDITDSNGTSYLNVAANKTIRIYDGANLRVGTTTGTKIGTAGGAAGQKLGFFDATPIVQPLLATGAGHAVDDVITALQNLGLFRQT